MADVDRRSLKRIEAAVELRLILGADFVAGITRNVSKMGFCIEIPTVNLKSGMMDKLNERVVIYLGDLICYGRIIWYDVDNGYYKVGVKLENGSRKKWWDLLGPVAEAQTATI